MVISTSQFSNSLSACISENVQRSKAIHFADVVLNYFLEAAMEEFTIGCVDQTQWHPDYRSHRVALFILVKKITKLAPQDLDNISDRKKSEEIN